MRSSGRDSYSGGRWAVTGYLEGGHTQHSEMDENVCHSIYLFCSHPREKCVTGQRVESRV